MHRSEKLVMLDVHMIRKSCVFIPLIGTLVSTVRTCRCRRDSCVWSAWRSPCSRHSWRLRSVFPWPCRRRWHSWYSPRLDREDSARSACFLDGTKGSRTGEYTEDTLTHGHGNMRQSNQLQKYIDFALYYTFLVATSCAVVFFFHEVPEYRRCFKCPPFISQYDCRFLLRGCVNVR